MQFVIISETQALIVDKVEHNPLQIDGHDAWSAVYNLNDNTITPVNLITNSFCANGAFLSNGTLINVGGNPVVDAELGDQAGGLGIRMFTPSSCATDAKQCAFFEDPSRIKLTSMRWYPGIVKLEDGSALIIGGALGGGFINAPSLNNPTLEFFPPKNINGFDKTSIPFSFLTQTLNANLFPMTFLLPSGMVMIVDNQRAILYDWKLNTLTSLPSIPNGVRVTYPMSGTGVLLPFDPMKDFEATVLVCGGSTKSDTAAAATYSSQDPTSAQCASLTFSASGAVKAWIVESMPVPRVMPDSVLLPTGQLVIVNGAQTGYAGFGNVNNLVGDSNADHPAFQPVLYDPSLPAGSRFSSSGLPTSSIARMYHSVASMSPSGSIIIAGSNPNNDVSTVKFATEYRLEVLSPPYIQQKRPSYTGLPANIVWKQRFNLKVQAPSGTKNVTAVLMDFGYSTHAVHSGQRMLHLVTTFTGSTLGVTFVANQTIFPPGPAYLFVLADGVPSTAQRVMIGDGANPPLG